MYPTSRNLQVYLASTPIIDHANPVVTAQALQLTEPCSGELEQVQRLFEWVRDRIPHTCDIHSDRVTCTASEVLAVGTGICFAKSHLLAALLRAIQIPAGFCYQVCTQDEPHTSKILHGFNGLYLKSCDRWIRLDPRGNTGTINAQFNLNQEQLAFLPNPDLGEWIYPQIWPAPLPTITALLTQVHSRQELWPQIPAAISDIYLSHQKPNQY